MPPRSLRGIPQDVYDGLCDFASSNHRSMLEQARLLIERDMRLQRPAAMERVRAWRQRMRSDRCPSCWTVCAPFVSAEGPPAQSPRPENCHVLAASALLRPDLADGPLPEALEAVMERGCRGDGLLLVPDLCWPELVSVLRRQISRELLSAEEGQELLEELLQLP